MQTLSDLYRRNARLFPDRDAFVLGEERRSYRDFHARARRLASALMRNRTARQDTVGLFASNSITYFEICAGCEMSARISALFNFRSAAPELAYLIDHAGCSILFFEDRFASVVEAIRLNRAQECRFICIGSKVPHWAEPYDAFLETGRTDDTLDEPEADDVCTLFYTSGTTGRPKGVPWRHRAMLIAAQRSCMTEDPSTLQISPAFHIGGRCPPVAAMWNAGKTVLDEGFEAGRWLEIIQNERINTTFMVPIMMQAVLDHPDIDRFDHSSLEWVLAGSTAIPPSLLTRAIRRFGPVFYVGYGSTECAGVTRMKRSETNADTPEGVARLASVGPAETPVEICLLDEDGNRVAPGEVGEVCVRSPFFTGYWNDPEASREALFGEYFRTGDMGRFDERDFLYLVDRRKDMIISGGENIYSREVEDALDRHDAVSSVAVIGIPDAQWGERVVAVVVRAPGSDLPEDELIAFSRTQLAKFKCPKHIVFVEELPVSGTGKVDKACLRECYAGMGEKA